MSTYTSVKIKINGSFVELRRHPENPELFCLNDAHRASGGAENTRPSEWCYLNSGKCRNKISEKGRYGGTFVDENTVYKYASWVDDNFFDAVIEAFKAAAHGKYKEAVDVASSFSVTPELLAEIHSASVQINQAIPLWDQMQKKPRGSRARVIIWDHIVCKTTTGGSLKSLKDAHGVDSLAEYFAQTENKAGVGAYLALANSLIPLLNAGVDYYVLREVFTKNSLKVVK